VTLRDGIVFASTSACFRTNDDVWSKRILTVQVNGATPEGIHDYDGRERGGAERYKSP